MLPLTDIPRIARSETRRRALWRSCGTAGALLIALSLFPAALHAETTTTAQAIADNGAFLPYAAPPPQPGGLCLLIQV